MPELLSPAGNFEKMRAAIRYGADAVYLAGDLFGMRSAADNFSDDELCEAVRYAHERSRKVYLTVNTMPHGYEYPALRKFLTTIKDFGIDAIIAADLGVIATVKEILPDMELHISTQASIVSPEAALAYAALGARRLVLARELTLDEIKAIRAALPSDVELEAFIHGSMCVSYSGRCMLSHHLTERDANRGACTQPCRWNYKIVEEKRPDVPLPVEENELGTFIMSSKDMCTIGIIPELIGAGIDSFKIEGRMKSAYYTAVVTNAYRMAIDAYKADPEGYVTDPALYLELDSVSHREYCTGYYLDKPAEAAQLASNVGYIREKSYFATALEYSESELPENLLCETEEGRLALFMQKNKVKLGDGAEIISPSRTGRGFCVRELYSETGEPIDCAPHPFMKFYVRVPFEVSEGDIMRSADRQRRFFVIIEILKAVLYGIVEGITEWLPVSSTGHLILLEEFLNFRAGETISVEFMAEFLEMFGVVIQLGAILAVVVIYFGKLNPISSSKSPVEKRATLSLWLRVIVASLPAAIMGVVGDKLLESFSGRDIDGWLYNAYVVAAALIVYGVLFIVIEKLNKNKKYEVTDVSQISYKKAFFIGIFQMLAMIPGTSRSGSTILGSMCLGLSRSVAAEFSFFMAIPVMAGASLVKLIGFFKYVFEGSLSVPAEIWLILATGCLTAFLVSLAAIRFLTDFVKKHSFSAFGIYRIALGILVLIYFILRG